MFPFTDLTSAFDLVKPTNDYDYGTLANGATAAFLKKQTVEPYVEMFAHISRFNSNVVNYEIGIEKVLASRYIPKGVLILFIRIIRERFSYAFLQVTNFESP